MIISIIGASYVGLIIGVCLAKAGNEVALIELDLQKVDAINSKRSSIYEEGLDELLNKVRIKVNSDYKEIENSEVVFVCVGTPSNEDGSIVLEQIENAAEQISKVLERKDEYCVVVVKSTVPPGTTEDIIIPLLQKSGKKVGEDFGVCVSPEFLREGKAIYDFMHPDRIVIAGYDQRSIDVLVTLYGDFNAPILQTSLKTAEMIKLASNTFLATKISFINEIGNICKQLGIDTYEVARGMGFDGRIGSKFLNAGIGFGGSCLPKDLGMLIARARKADYEPGILVEVSKLNEKQALKLVELLKKHVVLKGATIGILGLAFKPGTDDVRDSRAITVVQNLLQEGAMVKAYDPLAGENFKKLFPQVEYVNKEEVLNSDAILIVTEWEEFNHLDYHGKKVIDGRRILKAREASVYEGICW